MPPNYANSKIYSIRSHQTNMIYIGSTTQSLAVRMAGHRAKYKSFLNGKANNLSSFEIIKYDDAYIEMVEEYPCQNKMELERREGQIIRITENCINRIIVGRTRKEYYQDNADRIKDKTKLWCVNNADRAKARRKQYYQDNQDELKTKHKQYYIDNADKFKQYYIDNVDKKKQYYIDNADTMKEQKKQYYQDNADRIKDKARQKTNCLCGGKYGYGDKARHFKSQKHINYLALTEIPLSSDSQEQTQSPTDSIESSL